MKGKPSGEVEKKRYFERLYKINMSSIVCVSFMRFRNIMNQP